MEIYDVVIIGGGIIGSNILYELAKYNTKSVLVEKNNYFADETTNANSGVIHGGFDADTKKIEAKLNVKGNKLWQSEIFKNLDFPRAKIDSLVISFSKEEDKELDVLYQRGLDNGVLAKHLRIIDKNELLKIEPNLNPNVSKALLCTNSFAINPKSASLAFIGSALNNDLKAFSGKEVTDIKKTNDNLFEITINNNEKILTKNIINACGHYCDEIAKMAGYPDFKQTTRRGEYLILSKDIKHKVNSICFMVPTIHGKGVVVAPMLDGRTMVGPTAEENVDKLKTRNITKAKEDLIKKIGQRIIPNLELDRIELRLAGSRPIDIKTNDFVIQYAKEDNHFINVAGMQSPGISSSPAIAKMVIDMLIKNGLDLKKKENHKPYYKIFE